MVKETQMREATMSVDDLRAEYGRLDRLERLWDRITCPVTWVLRQIRRPSIYFAEAKEELLAKHNTYHVGNCETCGRLLLDGDMGYSFDDGPIFCAEHAPQWRDVKAMIADPDFWEEQEDRDRAQAALDAHMAAGGSMDDKVTYEL
jgi:hypothetical protein